MRYVGRFSRESEVAFSVSAGEKLDRITP